MSLRDHRATVIEDFNGYWKRGDADSVPLDHFSDCNNIAFIESGFETRPGLDTLLAKGNVLRLYNYKTQEKEGLLVLTEGGTIYHSLLDGSDVTYGPILTVNGMTDFGFHGYNGRAYITPYKTESDGLGNEFQRGLENEFVYVYKGDGTTARKAAGPPPVLGTINTTFKAFNSKFDGVVSKGVHFLTVVDQSNNILVPVFPVLYTPGNKEIELTDIPTSIGATSRKILMTRAIDPKDYVPDQTAFTYYEALLIGDNTTINSRLSVADSGLVVVASIGVIPDTVALQAEVSNTDGFMDLGFHLIAVVYETDTGYLTALGPENFASVNIVNIKKSIHVFNIPISPNTYVTKRHLVATRAILNYNGDQRGYQFYFIPNGTLNDNTTTELTLSFFDADLLEDASHLLDNFSEIPAGVVLTTYKSRMVLATTFEDISLVYLSAPGEPEAFDQVDGLVIIPLDGIPITNAQEYRDVLYVTKKIRTYAVIDNGQEPSEWPAPQPIDLGVGASIHGIAKVLDSDGVNIDFLLICDYSGIMIFNGAYSRPELTWKIQDFWFSLDRNFFSNMQIMNDSLSQMVYVTLPGNKMLIGDYKRGLDPKNIRWAIWSFDIDTQSIALGMVDTLIIGAKNQLNIQGPPPDVPEPPIIPPVIPPNPPPTGGALAITDATIASGQLTITGSGFGTYPDLDMANSPYLVAYNDFSAGLGTNGFRVDRRVNPATGNATIELVPNDRSGIGYCMLRQCPENYSRQGSVATQDILFNKVTGFWHISAWMKVITDAFQSGKNFWFWGDFDAKGTVLWTTGGTASRYPDWDHNLRAGTESGIGGGVYGSTQWTSPDKIYSHIWYRIDAFFRSDPNGDDTYEEFSLYLNNRFQYTKRPSTGLAKDNWLDNPWTPFGGRARMVYGSMLDSISSGYPSVGKWHCDACYLSTSWARVEIGNAATWNDSTVREVLPIRSWNDTTIVCDFKRGLFTQGATAYVYVVGMEASPTYHNACPVSTGFEITVA